MPAVRKRRFATGLSGVALALSVAGTLLLGFAHVRVEQSMNLGFQRTLDNLPPTHPATLPRKIQEADFVGADVIYLSPASLCLFLPLFLATGSFFLDREVQRGWLAKTSASAVLILHLMLLATVCECRRYGIPIVL